MGGWIFKLKKNLKIYKIMIGFLTIKPCIYCAFVDIYIHKSLYENFSLQAEWCCSHLWRFRNIFLQHDKSLYKMNWCCLITTYNDCIKLFLTLCDPMGCSLLGSSNHGIFQARILEWVAISFSRGSSQSKDWTHVFCIGRQILYHWTTREVQPPISPRKKDKMNNFLLTHLTLIWILSI